MLPLARLSAAPKKFGFSVFDIMKNAKKGFEVGENRVNFQKLRFVRFSTWKNHSVFPVFPVFLRLLYIGADRKTQKSTSRRSGIRLPYALRLSMRQANIVIFSHKGRKELKGFANYAFFAAHHISWMRSSSEEVRHD